MCQDCVAPHTPGRGTTALAALLPCSPAVPGTVGPSGLTSPLLLQVGPCSVTAALSDPECRREMSHWMHQSSAGWCSRATCITSLGDGSASSSGPACARGTVLGCSEEAGLCLRAPFSLKTRAHTGQSHWDPLANISGLGTLWVLQRGASGLSLDGDEVALAAAEPACGGQEAPTSSGT